VSRLLDPRGGCERVPAHEVVCLLAGKPDDAVVSLGPFGLLRITVGELRELSIKGQGVDIPRLLSDPHGIWKDGR
jgi:hypothetical protein